MPSTPLFPLRSILFPGVRLALQVFEPRYLDMISQCLKSGTGFGVVMIREGEEVGEVPQVFSVGVIARIVDWTSLPSGLLGVTIEGERKFRIRRTWAEANQLLMAEVEYLADEPPRAIGEHHQGLLELLQQLSAHPAVQELKLPEVDDARQLGWQLTQLLPLSKPDKVALLEVEDPQLRLEQLAERVDQLSSK